MQSLAISMCKSLQTCIKNCVRVSDIETYRVIGAWPMGNCKWQDNKLAGGLQSACRLTMKV